MLHAIHVAREMFYRDFRGEVGCYPLERVGLASKWSAAYHMPQAEQGR